MASLKDLKNRIGSVKSTQKITKAMKMVAASKLRRAQESVEAARPYAERMEAVISSLAASVTEQAGAPKLLAGTGSTDVHLIVVATSERGLCGAFNGSIVRAARRAISGLRAQGKTVKLLCVGKKGLGMLTREFGDLMLEPVDISAIRSVAFSDAQPIAGRILKMFEAGEFDVCTVFYNRFKSVMTQVVTEQQIIPVSLESADEAAPAVDLGGAIYEYEPSEEQILADLLPRNVAVQLFRVLLENAASEQGARMTAMDNATRNAGEMIDKLSLIYNRTRQATITKELIEIISGAEAL
ncbi:MAG: F0F1 ATP synthase subunit gamma [Sphingomonadales bacterium]